MNLSILIDEFQNSARSIYSQSSMSHSFIFFRARSYEKFGIKCGYYRKLGDPSVYTGCCLFTLGQYRYESTWYSSLLFIVVCLTRRNERHLVIFLKSSPGNLKKRVIIQVQSCITKCLSFRRVSFFQGYRLCIYLRNFASE